MIPLDAKLSINKDLIFSPNLCDRFKDEDLNRIGQEVWMGYRRDRFSRIPWEGRMTAAMDLAMQMQRAKNFPWPNCANVVFPLVTISALQFSARTYSNIIQGTNIVRYRSLSNNLDKLQSDRAKRLGKHMSWQILEQDESWEEVHQRLFMSLAVIGSAFIKSYYDPAVGYPVAELVMAKDLVIDYFAKSTEAAARKTHEYFSYRNEIHEKMVRETYRDCLDEPWFTKPARNEPTDMEADRRLGITVPQPDDDAAFRLLEQHRWLDLDKDGYAEPYTVTIEKVSKKVLRIVARFSDEDSIERVNKRIACIKPTEYFTKYSFIPSPDGGIYDLGFGIFLGPINEAVNTGINQMLDFGTMQNSLGGLFARGAKIRGGVYTMAPWEFKRVDSSGDDLRKSIFMWPDRSPPDFMFKLLGLLIEYANRISGTVDATVGENPGQNTPASTFQGMTEMGLQTYKMSYKAVWRCMKQEFRRRFELNRDFLKQEEKFGSGQEFIRKEDYSVNSDFIAPVANPNITSIMMKTTQAAAVKQSAMTTPGYDLYEVELRFLDTLEIEDVGIIYPGPGKVPEGHSPVNPKVAVEQMKMQLGQMKIQEAKMKWANELMEEQRLNNAKIKLLEAQAMAAAADANAVIAAQKIEAFEQLIQMHSEYGDQLNKRISALLGEGGEGDNQQTDDGGGLRKLEGQQSNASGAKPVSVQVPGGSQVSVGGGGVQP